MAFADNLKKVREGLGFTKVQAATRLAMSYQQYEALEREGSNPTLSTIDRIASNFGVSKRKLVGG